MSENSEQIDKITGYNYYVKNSTTLDRVTTFIERIMKFGDEPTDHGSHGGIYTSHELPEFAVKITHESFLTRNDIREISALRALYNAQNVVRMALFLYYNKKYVKCLDRYQMDLGYAFDYYNLSETDNIDIAYKIIKGVCELHSRRIYHRDIKPYNILVTRPCRSDRSVVVCDFGLLRYMTDICNEFPEHLMTGKHERFTDVVQTITHRAPEVLLKMPYSCSKIDVWSVGITIIELFMRGKLIRCPDENTKTALYHIVRRFGQPKNEKMRTEFLKYLNVDEVNVCGLPILPPLVKDLVEKMTAIDPGERITIFDAVKHPLFADKEQYDVITDKLAGAKILDIYHINLKKYNYDYIELLFEELFCIILKCRDSYETFALTCFLTKLYCMTHEKSGKEPNRKIIEVVMGCYFLSSSLYELHDYDDFVADVISKKHGVPIDVDSCSSNVLEVLCGDILFPTVYNYWMIKKENIHDEKYILLMEYLVLITTIYREFDGYDKEYVLQECEIIADSLFKTYELENGSVSSKQEHTNNSENEKSSEQDEQTKQIEEDYPMSEEKCQEQVMENISSEGSMELSDEETLVEHFKKYINVEDSVLNVYYKSQLFSLFNCHFHVYFNDVIE